MISIDEINKLKEENAKLNAIIDGYQPKIQALKVEIAELQAYKDVNEDFKTAWEEIKAENERLSSWLASSEKQRMEVCNVIHKKKEQIQTLKYMLFDEKEIPKDKFTMYYRIAQNERRTKSHRDLCTNIVKKYKQTLQEIKEIAEQCMNKDTCYDCKYYDDCYI